jgi:hypothetical protein
MPKPLALGTAACFGSGGCPHHATCPLYRKVELPGQERFVSTCRTPEGRYPLFEPRRAVAAVVDGEGSEI